MTDSGATLAEGDFSGLSAYERAALKAKTALYPD